MTDQSTLAAIAAVAVAALGALVVYFTLEEAGWLAMVAVVLVGVGALAGSRGPVGVGVGVLAITSLFATGSDASARTLTTSALVAALCIAVLVVADVSFAMRRAATVSQETVQGFILVHAGGAFAGVALAVMLLGAVLAVSWPGWLLLLPAIVLGVASGLLAREASRYNRKLREVPAPAAGLRLPPPPPPGIKSTMPPPPAPGARPTRRIPPPPPGAVRQR